MAWLNEHESPERWAITVAGLRALGREIPAGLEDDQTVGDWLLRDLAERSAVTS